jgi:hypothetical protein
VVVNGSRQWLSVDMDHDHHVESYSKAKYTPLPNRELLSKLNC